MTTSKIEDAFCLFATTGNFRERQRAFSDLVALKALPKRVDDPRFEQGIHAWEELLRKRESDALEGLVALAELVRTSQVIKNKEWSERLGHSIASTTERPLPPCNLLKDADERLNIARACSMSPESWVPRYVAQAIAEEDAGEKARAEFLDVLLARTESLAEAFALLGDAFSAIRFETEAPGDSMAKRLIRTLAAMRPILLKSLLQAGSGAGRRLDEFLRIAMRSTGKPRDEKTQIDLTREVALTLHDLVRSHFSMATEPETFDALKQCRAFFPGVFWPTSLGQPMDLLVQDISEALLMLGRQNVPQQALLDRLELVCGLKERARAIATQMAERNDDLPERIREWLRRGRLVQVHSTSEVLQASLLEANDTSVGLALIEASKLQSSEDTFQRMLGTIEIYEPSMVRSASGYGQMVRDVIGALKDVASRRGISLLGAEGEEIEFNSKYFDPLRALNGPRVIVKRPAILRSVGTHSGTDVVLKGLVE